MIEEKFQTLFGKMAAAAMVLSCRVTRGGPRIIIGLVVMMMVITAYMTGFSSSRDSFSSFTQPLYNKWQSMGTETNTTGGGLRVVVFGTPDVASVSGIGPSQNDKSWTKKLCEEIKCSEYISYIPYVNTTDFGGVDAALTSNTLWQNALGHVTGPKFNSKVGGFDYTWVEDQYPTPEHPDLLDQVTSFISTAQPSALPKETLWVFNFGTWDIWYLAALPREAAVHYIDSLVIRIFSQIEFLYQESLNERSIAYSAFWHYSSLDLLAEARKTDSKTKPSSFETFRVLIPKLLDISITPGWHDARPIPPSPHSKVEQERNALFLTDRWNEMVGRHVTQWINQFNPSTEDEYEKYLDSASDVEPKGPYIQASAQKASKNSKGYKRATEEEISPEVSCILADLDSRDAVQLARQAEGPAGVGASAKIQKRWKHTTYTTADGNPLVASFPRRVAAQFDEQLFISEAIIEQQFRKANISDHIGRGDRPDSDLAVYDEVWKPCVVDEMNVTSLKVCTNPEDHLFESLFFVGQRARDAIANRAGQTAYDQLLLSKPSSFTYMKEENIVDHGNERVKKPQSGYQSGHSEAKKEVEVSPVAMI